MSFPQRPEYIFKFLEYPDDLGNKDVICKKSGPFKAAHFLNSVAATPVSNQAFSVSFTDFPLYLKYAHSPDVWSTTLVAEL